MSDKDAGKSDDDILDEARKRYALCVDADSDNHQKALADLRFLSGDQWDDKDKTRRTIEGRPCLTINKLPTFLHQVTNEQRMNKPGIKVHPVDDKADEETAEVEQGLVRHIEYASNADVAYDTAVNNAAACGFGYFQLTTDYCSPTSFDQDIKFKRIRNPLSVKVDPLSQAPDGSDMQYCFIESQMARTEFEKLYPDANANNMTLFQNGTAYQYWLSEDTVLVCEYYRIVKDKATVVLLTDGTSGYKDERGPLPAGVQVKATRESFRKRIEWFKLTGVDILERTEIKMSPEMGQWIPVFPVYGDEIDIEGKVTRSGLVRYAKDPAQMYNYWMTSATEEVAMRNKTPYIGAEGQFEGYEDDWANANTTTFAYLQYKPVTSDGNLAPAPVRQPMADVPTGVLAMAMHASDNIKATTGLFDSSLGARSTANSGKQEIAQQRQGDMANFHYTDNLNRTVRHAGRVIISMIPFYYDSERVVRILGEDDTASHTKINAPIPPGEQELNEETGAIKTVLNDMTVGTYDVTVKSGPSYDTMRQESAEFFSNAMSSAKDPVTSAVVTYLAMKNQDVPGAEEATEMLKKMIPANILPPDQGKEDAPMVMTQKGPVPVEQAGQIIDQLGAHLEQMQPEMEKKAAELAAQEQELVKLRNQLEEKAISVNYESKLQQSRESFTKQLLQAQEEAADAQQKAALTEALAQVEQIVASYTEKVEEMIDSVKTPANSLELEQDQADKAKQSELQGLLQQQHEQMFAQLQAVVSPLVAAMSAPRRLVRDDLGRPVGSEVVN